VKIDNSITGEDLVLASVQKDRMIIEAVNYTDPRNVKLTLGNLGKAFPGSNKLRIVKYLIDSKHSNCLNNPGYQGDIEKIGDTKIITHNGQFTLKHENLEKNGLVLWEVIQTK